MLAKAIRYEDGIANPVEDPLVPEEALQIKINGRPYTITMRTPGEDAFLTQGLLFTEHLIRRKQDIIELQSYPSEPLGNSATVEVILKPQCPGAQPLGGRTLVSSSSCGLCGKTDMESLSIPQTPIRHHLKLEINRLRAMQELTSAHQTLFHATGGCHAAAAFTIDGLPLAVMEDIGRHNAVDKVVGFLLERERLNQADVLHVSGRVSYEIVAKSHAAKIPFLTSVSAPSSLAVKMCEQLNITLISFCRGTKSSVYTHPTSVVGG